jgi:hypothetical protein
MIENLLCFLLGAVTPITGIMWLLLHSSMLPAARPAHQQLGAISRV